MGFRCLRLAATSTCRRALHVSLARGNGRTLKTLADARGLHSRIARARAGAAALAGRWHGGALRWALPARGRRIVGSPFGLSRKAAGAVRVVFMGTTVKPPRPKHHINHDARPDGAVCLHHPWYIFAAT